MNDKLAGLPSGRVHAAIEHWQAELLDLSKMNRLVYFKTGASARTLTDPEPAAIFDALVNRGRVLSVYRADDQFEDVESTDQRVARLLADEPEASGDDDASEGTLARALRPNEVAIGGEAAKLDGWLYRLRLKARAALMDQGTNVLFVTFGLLEWTEASASAVPIVSPLLLLPVRLDRETALQPYTLTPLDEQPVVNPTLAYRLQTDFKLGLTLPEAGDEDLSLSGVLDHIRQLVKGRSSWRVLPDVHLGLFSFAKHAMYADLAANRERLSGNPLIRAIAGEATGLPEPIGTIPSADKLDEQIRPESSFQVLDADASQREAIAAVAAGANLVIHGPPGTGKSQTITNIIAETLAQGKTVLFVSEKMAALGVVAKRLNEAGLGAFCLEAHTQGSKPGEVIKALASTLQTEVAARAAGGEQQLAALGRVRADLTAYVRALHDAQNPLGWSAFRVHGEVASRHDAPAIIFDLPEIGSLTQARLADLLAIVQRLTHTGEALLAGGAHPWRGCTVGAFNPSVQADLDQRLRYIAGAADGLARAQDALRTAWALPPAGTLGDATWLRDLLRLLEHRPTVPAGWLLRPAIDEQRHTAMAYKARTRSYLQRRAALLSRYAQGIFSLDLAQVRAALEDGGDPHAKRVRGAGEPADRAVQQRARLERGVKRAHKAVEALRENVTGLAARLGLDAPTTLTEARDLLDLAELVLRNPRPSREWFDVGRRNVLEELATQAASHQEAAAASRQALLESFDEDIMEVANGELADRFEQTYASWMRVLRPGYYRDLGQLRRLVKGGQALGYDDAVAALRKGRRLEAATHWLDEHRAELAASFGHHYAAARTDWRAVQTAVETVREILARFTVSAPPQRLLDCLLGLDGGPASLESSVAALRTALEESERAVASLEDVASLADLPFGGVSARQAPLDMLAMWLPWWISGLQPLWDAVDALVAHRLDRTEAVTVEALAEDAAEAESIDAEGQALGAAAGHLHGLFGSLYAGLATDWDALLVAIDWTRRLLGQVAEPLSEAFVQVVTSDAQPSSAELADLDRMIEAATTAVEELRPAFTADAYPFATDLGPTDLRLASAWASEKRAVLPRLQEWIDLQQAIAAARAAGLVDFVRGIVRDRPAVETWRDAFLRQVYTLWLTWCYEQAPILNEFRRQPHEGKIAEFRRLDEWHWRTASGRIGERLVAKQPKITLNMHPQSEPAILMKESVKKRRFRPLRKLFADLPNILPALRPCMLMSPLAVAQYLGESAITFDLVIFDEASQILPADAIGSIARGRQVVVVGDQQQLPPTRFFAAVAQGSDGDDDEEAPESVLDACLAARLPQKSLLWHYRSRHEDLIAFSNRYFYDGRLVTFPSPNAGERAVQFIHAEDGIYERGAHARNRVEARRIADLVVEHVEEHRNQSLGVITFSEAQMVAILAEIDARKRERPELEALISEKGSEGFFVKNLENVQGDERDVIFFSVGYGPDQAGHMTMNFGPLNRSGGERRLNVAVTRARDHVKILASFRPHAIDLGRTQAKGVHLLRRYLEFAEQGPTALLGAVTSEGGEPDSPFEWSVLNALEARGLRVVSQVGVGGFRIDLGIKDEYTDRYLLGIECDGATYHSSRTARDRDRLRQQVLERLGWTIQRIWSTDWIKQPEHEVERVLAALEIARAQTSARDQGLDPHTLTVLHPDDDPGVDGSDAGIVVEELPASESLVVSGSANGTMTSAAEPSAATSGVIAQPYRSATFPLQGSLDTFRSTSPVELAPLVRWCVRIESPVHEDRVMRTIAASFGIEKLGKQIRQRLLSAIDVAAEAGEIERRGEFLWTRGMGAAIVRAADPDGQVRPIREVPPEEIADAATRALEALFAINRDALVAAVARELGYDRTGSQVSAAIGAVLDQLLSNGAIVDVGGQLRLAA